MVTCNKTIELKNILDCYNVKPNCAVLFDDTSCNGKSAEALGIHWSESNAWASFRCSDLDQPLEAICKVVETFQGNKGKEHFCKDITPIYHQFTQQGCRLTFSKNSCGLNKDEFESGIKYLEKNCK